MIRNWNNFNKRKSYVKAKTNIFRRKVAMDGQRPSQD